MKYDLSSLHMFNGPDYRKDYSQYSRSEGILGKTIEATGEIPTPASFRHREINPWITVLLFTDGTYFVCHTWME